MSNFPAIFAQTLANEGTYSNDPHDPGNWTGGACGVGTCDGTMYGISAQVARANGYTGPMDQLPLALAQSIAQAEYYNKYQCDEFVPEIAFQVFDAAYNGGHPAQWLQRAVGVKEDGHIGPQTIAAVIAAWPDRIVMRFIAYRQQWQATLPAWAAQGKGWANRNAANLLRAAASPETKP